MQRRAFVLQTHHCESASLGLKPNLFGIYGNKVSCSVSLSFFLSSYTAKGGKCSIMLILDTLKYVLKQIFQHYLHSALKHTLTVQFWYSTFVSL